VGGQDVTRCEINIYSQIRTHYAGLGMARCLSSVAIGEEVRSASTGQAIRVRLASPARLSPSQDKDVHHFHLQFGGSIFNARNLMAISAANCFCSGASSTAFDIWKAKSDKSDEGFGPPDE
jgi:hypothetical protein